ncbi:hypothetical protein GCM10009753_67890 [Streptantibioticus ferralitis]
MSRSAGAGLLPLPPASQSGSAPRSGECSRGADRFRRKPLGGGRQEGAGSFSQFGYAWFVAVRLKAVQ